jgi:hypothetical protein
MSQSTLAVDPETGNALILRGHDRESYLLKDNVQNGTIKFPLRTYWEPKLSPAGDDNFHALVIGNPEGGNFSNKNHVLFLEFFSRVWSAPVDLGETNVADHWLGGPWNLIQIGSSGRCDVLAVWPTKQGIVARWISLVY